MLLRDRQAKPDGLTSRKQEYKAMTDMLEKAVAQTQRLPEAQQDAIAVLILEEIGDEGRWDDAFARSRDVLERLAAAAEAEHRQGLTEELDPDTL
jgi:hypothetical protein